MFEMGLPQITGLGIFYFPQIWSDLVRFTQNYSDEMVVIADSKLSSTVMMPLFPDDPLVVSLISKLMQWQ
jgi:hypothetical protein